MSEIPCKSNRTLRRPNVFISYKHGKNFDLAKSFSSYLRARGIQTYMDVDYEPVNDPDGLAMGLSAGLATSPVLLAFISHEYIDSPWCREELRQFIYAHGKRFSDEEIRNRALLFPEGQRALLSKQPHPIPIILVAIDEGIGLQNITHALSKKNMTQILADTNRRATVIRGPADDPRYYEDSLEYMRIRGIDPAHYISDLPLLSIRTMSAEALVEKLVSLIKESLQKFNELEKTDPTLLNIHTIWTNLWDRYCMPTAREINPNRVIDALTQLPTHNSGAHGDIEANHSGLIIDILYAISAGISRVSYFDRRVARSQSSRRLANYDIFLPQIPDTLEQFFKLLRESRDSMIQEDLRLSIKAGTPLDVLYAETMECDIIRPLQNSYYLFNVRHGRNSLVDITVVACIAINISLAFESISKWELLEEVVLTPLLRHKDIRNLFPGPFQSETMLRENLEVEEKYYKAQKARAYSEHRRRRRKVIQRIKESHGKKQK